MSSSGFNERDSQGNAFVSTSDENLEISEEKLDGPPWSELPAPAVEKVYSFLNRSNQNSMSLVCRNWRNEYSSPSLWRRVKFCFPDVESNTALRPEVIFARRFGSMFHHVEIVFQAVPPPFSLMHFAVLKQLISFMQAITRHSQLLSISLKNMIYYLLRVNAETSAEVSRAILDLLKSQKRLQCVEFLNCEFQRDEAAEILNAIFTNNSKTLRRLCVLGLIEDPLNKFKDSTMDPDLNFAVLMNLEVLEINYTEMFESMMLSFYKYRNKVDVTEKKGCLKEIKLMCNGFNGINYLKIHPPVWQYFKNIFPDLRIEVVILSSCDSEMFATYIVPHMPLRALTFKFISCFDQIADLGSLLRHITSCEINKSLEMLRVFWDTTSPDFSEELISFTNTSPKLKILVLQIRHSVTALDTVFNSWLENRPPSLAVVKLIIVDPNEEEEETNYARLNDFYAPLLQLMGLSLTLSELVE